MHLLPRLCRKRFVQCLPQLRRRPGKTSDQTQPLLEKYPPQTEELLKPVEAEKFKSLLEKYREVEPHRR
jgi:hypothetical protein